MTFKFYFNLIIIYKLNIYIFNFKIKKELDDFSVFGKWLKHFCYFEKYV